MKRILIFLFLLIAVPAWGGLPWYQAESETKTYLSLPNADKTAIKTINNNVKAIKNGGSVKITGLTCNLSLTNGSAFITNPSTDLRPYVGYGITLLDTVGIVRGYIKAAGTGETYGAEKITGFTNSGSFPFETFTTSGVDISEAINSTSFGAGGSNNLSLSSGNLFLYTSAITINSGVLSAISIGQQDATIGSYILMGTSVTTGNKSIYVTTTNDVHDILGFVVSSDVAVNFSALNNSLKVVATPSITGVTITSTAGGDTYNWASNAEINPNYASFTTYIGTSPRSMGVLLGDSTTASYSGTNGVDYYMNDSDYFIYNQARAGDTILQQQTIWTNDPYKANYDWIIVRIGLNDLNPEESAATALGRYQTLINTINSGKKAGAKVIVGAMTPCKQRLIDVYNPTNGLVAYQKWLDMNTAIMGGGANAITGTDAQINSYNTKLNDGNGNLAATYDTGDGIHPNNTAREIIGDVYDAALQALGF